MADLPDVNVCVALASRRHAHHAAAAAWFDRLAVNEVAFCRVTQMSLLRLLAQPAVMGADVLTFAEAWQTLDQLMSDERVMFHREPEGLEKQWRQFSLLGSASGTLTDAYLAAFAANAGLRLVTFDQGFTKFPGVKLLNLLTEGTSSPPG